MQDLKPTIWVGKRGMTDTMIDEIIRQLKDRKMIKIKWLRSTDVVPEEIALRTGAELVQVRGHTMILAEGRSGRTGREPRQ